MTRHFFLFLIFISLFKTMLGATKVFVSTSLGDDNNSGFSEKAPLHSISKALTLGEEIFLKAGDVFLKSYI